MGDSKINKPKPSNVGKPAARKKARKFLLQAMYQWHITKTPINELEKQFRTDFDMKKADIEYFHDVLHGIPKHVSELDKYIEPYLERRVDELDPIELSVFRIAVYELTQRVDVPYKVVINEAIELAKLFGATDSHKYVNGVLDKLAQKLRVMEFKQKGKGSSETLLSKEESPKQEPSK